MTDLLIPLDTCKIIGKHNLILFPKNKNLSYSVEKNSKP